MEEKRRKYSTSSDDSDTTDSHVTSWSKSSKTVTTKNNWARQKEKKPSEVFRTDLITAMKVPDSCQLNQDDYYILADPWRQEWEKGVQVPANVEAIPEASVRILGNSEDYLQESHHECTQFSRARIRPSEEISRYDLNEIDVCWLELVNTEFHEMGLPELDENTMERVIEAFERNCFENMNLAIETEEGLGIEYDEDVVCDVCRSPEGEDGNEMVFCDKCNVCVHQACYGILKVPTGNWLCRTCALGVQPKCLLCPKRGGALKPTRSGTKWVHVSCALWIPEVSIGCPEKMEPITKISHIPASRWALSCSLCRECTGTCIQCSMPSCITAFHVTCAFDNNLEMTTLLTDNDEVRFKSYCLEHSSKTKSDDSRPQPGGSVTASEADQSKQDLEKISLRKQKLQQLEEDFSELVKPAEVAERLDLPELIVDFIYQYWKLKRKSNFNKPLLSFDIDEVDNLAQQEQDVLYRRLKLFTHLRQDLERVRNLCYMVIRREKMKQSICNLQEQIFHLQQKLIENNLQQVDQPGRKIKAKQMETKRKQTDRQKSISEKKEKLKSANTNTSLLGQLGLPSSFPIDGTVFSSWLAQSVHITTEEMMSQWPLNNGHQDAAAALLTKELLQDETFLRLIMEQSLNSSLQQAEETKKSKNKIRMSSRKRTSKNGIGAIYKSNPANINQWTSLKCVTDDAVKCSNHDCKTNRQGRGLGKSSLVRKRTTEGKKAAKKMPSHQQLSKSKLSHTALAMVTPENHSEERNCFQSKQNSLDKVPGSAGCPKTVVRFKLPDDGKVGQMSHIKKRGTVDRPHVSNVSHFVETDGYFSDVEISDSDMESSKGRTQLSSLDSGNEDIVRMGILAS
ncbi:E3 ubiquitin-protein ligase Jade-2 [Protopterus annectens]|uniref:E3 ubiquitin-protein ligase Jade-2 n=1 Tax=Protopterus annectens TaxID=7888 RepID=UPI001CF9463B|nr:E3 ubiquitin-protein ligase Jade-2 [Protopterus annectens]